MAEATFTPEEIATFPQGPVGPVGPQGEPGVTVGAVSVLEHGAAGDGTTDDSEAFREALRVGVAVVVPPGTYLVENVTVPGGRTLRLAAGATVRLKPGALTHALVFDEPDARLLGPGTVDGDRRNQSKNVMAISVRSTGVLIDGVTVTGSGYYGIHAQACSGLTVTRCRIVDCVQSAVFVDGSQGSLEDIEVSHNRVDRSAEPSGSEGGIYLYAEASGTMTITRARIVSNDVRLHPQASSDTAACIVTRHVQRSTVTANTTVGGAMGISIDRGVSVTVTANTVQAPRLVGIELAAGSENTVAANTVRGANVTADGINLVGPTAVTDSVVDANTIHDCVGNGVKAVGGSGHLVSGNVIDGNGHTLYGIQLGGGVTDVTVCDNKIKGCAQHAILVQGGSPSQIQIVANTISSSVAKYAVQTVGCTRLLVASNLLNGNGIATKGLFLHTGGGYVISGNSVHGFTQHGINLYADVAVVVDNVSVVGNVITQVGGTPIGATLSGGAALGSNVKYRGNIGIADCG